MTSLVCPRCSSSSIRRHGWILSARGRVTRYDCRTCGKRFHPSLKQAPLVLREGYLDIEAAGLKANFDVMYAWSIKPRGSDVIRSGLITPYSLAGEKRLVRDLIAALDEYDRVITYNGANYDIPFIRSRALRHGLRFPEYMQLYHHDLYFVARGRLSAHSKRLSVVAGLLGVPGKVDLDPRDWELAQFGDRAALRRILKHNRQDVRVLEYVHEKLEPYYQGTNRSI